MNMCLHYIKNLAKNSVSERLSDFMSVKQKVLVKSFIESQFGYWTLIWMFHGRGVNNNH